MKSEKNGIKKYEHILDMQNHKSSKHFHMSIEDRAAQFGSFAALTGHKEAVQETARQTLARIELDEYKIIEINEKLKMLSKDKESEIKIIFFEPDLYKNGGAYKEHFGRVLNINLYNRILVMEDGVSIPIDEIIEIEFMKSY